MVNYKTKELSKTKSEAVLTQSCTTHHYRSDGTSSHIRHPNLESAILYIISLDGIKQIEIAEGMKDIIIEEVAP